MYGDPATVRTILTELGDTWAIVGLSTNQQRAAYGVADVLQSWGRATEGGCPSLASTAGREYISPRNAAIVTAEGHWPDGIKEDRSCPTTSSIARSARRKSP